MALTEFRYIREEPQEDIDVTHPQQAAFAHSGITSIKLAFGDILSGAPMFQLPCDEMRKVLAAGGQLVDVRQPQEFARGALPGATNIPLEILQEQKDTLDPARPVLLYCRSGRRSGMAREYLAYLGFQDVYNIGAYQSYTNC